MYHVLTEQAAKTLGILDAEGAEQPHAATLAQVAAAAESMHETFTAARAAARETGEERWVIDPDGDSSWISAQPTYTYTIFDADPQSSSGTEWPSHQDIEIDAADDDQAIADVREVMSTEAAGLSTDDGYGVGDRIHAIVWDEDGTIVGQPSYELTRDDLGVEDDAERLARAAKHVDATDLGDGKWAHYADETSRWYVVTADDLAELCDYLDDDDAQISRDAYSHWCAGTSGEEMPEGWSPDDGLPSEDDAGEYGGAFAGRGPVDA